MGVRSILRTPTLPLPPMRDTRDILSDVDHQLGRIASLRERAVELINKMEDGRDGSQ